MDATADSVQPFEQFVLLSVVELSANGGTPAHSYDVTQTAKARIEDIDRGPFGGIERQEVITALASLSEAALLEKTETDDAVGKGRPAYELAVATDDVLDTLSGDDNVGSYAQSLAA